MNSYTKQLEIRNDKLQEQLEATHILLDDALGKLQARTLFTATFYFSTRHSEPITRKSFNEKDITKESLNLYNSALRDYKQNKLKDFTFFVEAEVIETTSMTSYHDTIIECYHRQNVFIIIDLDDTIFETETFPLIKYIANAFEEIKKNYND